MPVINAWGDQITNEIVRQCLDEKGCYSLDRPGEWKTFAGEASHFVDTYRLN